MSARPHHDDLPEDPPADGEEDDDELIDPDDPTWAPLQQNIKQKLTQQLEEAVLALKENTTELDRIKKDRENTGVELYGVQQHLAKLQEQCDKRSDDLKAVENLRDEREKAKAALQIELEAKKKESAELRTKYFKYQADLDKLSETLLRVEQFNEHMQSEIAIERRSAYKAEDQIKDLEKKKEIQDLLIDTLNEQIKQANEKLALYESQLDAQRRETRLAQETLTEALREMEAIKFETKQLMQQWKTSLIGMQRRDEALKATEEALEKQKESLLALDNEISGDKFNIKKEQDRNEQLTHTLAKTEGEVSWLDQQIEALMQKKAKGMERLNMLNRSQQETEEEAKTIDRECTTLENQIKTLENKTQNINRDIRKLEAVLMEKLSEQTTFKKGTESTLQMIERKKKSIREMELQVTNMENELARIRLDTLQTQAHKETLEETVAALEKEKSANLSLHDRMKVDIRRRHDEIERKQKHLDKLNRQYDDFISQHGETSGEGVGPLEATINNLSKSITAKSNENDQLQREWIKAQTELVNLKNQSSELEASIRELRADTTILEQKKLRLEAQTQAEKDDKHDLERKTTEYHQRKKKLDLQLSKNRDQSTETANANANLQEELKRKSQEKKEERDRLEATINDRREEKQRIMINLLETEQQIMGWEKKIQIAKETELAVDPNVGKEEIQRMRQEISMMEQRLAGLKREHSRKLEALNQAVDHRDTLRHKGKAIQANSKNGVTKAQLQRENARLAGDLKKKKGEASTADKQIKASMQNTEQIAQQVDTSQQQNEELRMQLSALQQDVHVQTLVRDRLFKEKSRRQLTHQRLREAEKGQYKMALRPETSVHEKRRLEERWKSLAGVRDEILKNYPDLRADIQSILGQ